MKNTTILKVKFNQKIFLLTAFFSLLFMSNMKAQNEFITTWDLSRPNGTGTLQQVQFEAATSGSVTYNVFITAGAGSNSSGSFGSGVVTIPITGGDTTTRFRMEISNTNLQRFHFGTSSYDSQQLMSVTQWGTTAWTSMERTFFNCVNMTLTATDVPNLSGCTSLQFMFVAATSFNTDISNWNVSTITDFNQTFRDAVSYTNGGVSLNTWNPVAATDMRSMFSNTRYNMPLNSANWCGTALNGVTRMFSMFGGNTAFNQDISCWDVSTVQDFENMFGGATSYTNAGVSLNTWNPVAATNMRRMLSNTRYNMPLNSANWCSTALNGVTDMSSMFEGNTAFNQDISCWDVSTVTSFNAMFQAATSYTNLDVSLNSWNPVAATDMARMFNSTRYNMPLNSANWCGTGLNGVTLMNNMFFGNTAFNQDISCWDVSTVQDFSLMFAGATSYTNQGVSLQIWNPVAAINMTQMFSGTRYNMPLQGNWCGNTLQGVTSMRNMFGNTSDTGPNTVFNQDISCWDVSTVQNFNGMFQGATSYTNLGVSLNSWNPVAATTMGGMFGNCRYNMPLNSANWCGTTLNGVLAMNSMFAGNTVFNQDISCWDVSTVTNFSSMFEAASSYNNGGVSLQSWNPVAASDMQRMFLVCAYNLPLSGNWCGNTLNGVLNMARMFQDNTVFNQDLSCWDVSTVTDFGNANGGMFTGASAFNQNLGSWNINAATNMNRFLDNSGLSTANYDATLTGWSAAGRNPIATTFGAVNLRYCSAAPARTNLIATANLTPVGDIVGCSPGGLIITGTFRYWLLSSRYTGAAGPVSTVLDYTGSNNDFLQATPGNQPHFTNTATINFNPLFDFDGTNDFMATSGVVTNPQFNYNVLAANRTATPAEVNFTSDNSTLLSPFAWMPTTIPTPGSNTTEFITLDLGIIQPVNGIITAGRFTNVPTAAHWTTSYTVSHSTDNITYTPLGVTFTGNVSQFSTVTNTFAGVVNARYIRVFPQTWNGLPALRLDVFTTANRALTAFIVSQEDARQNNTTLKLGYTDADNQMLLSNADGAGNATLRGNLASNLVGGTTVSLSSPAPAVGVPSIGAFTSSPTGNQIFQNGRLSSSGTGIVFNTDIQTLGGFPTGTFFNGKVAEVAYYNATLNSLQFVQVLSYLAVKYGIALSDNFDGDGIANEPLDGAVREGDYLAANSSTVIWNYLSNVGYRNNVFGLGRDDSQDLNQRIAAPSNSTDVVTISTDTNYTAINSTHATITNNLSYLLMGNNGATVAGTITTDLPSTVAVGSRTAREWRIQRTGFVGQGVNLRVNVSSFLPSATLVSNIALVLDRDGNGNFTNGTVDQVIATSFDGTFATFENVLFDSDASGADVFTIGLLFCTQLPNTAAATASTQVGISTHATKPTTWPANGFLTLESASKGFVITRLTTVQRDALTPIEGMLLYNITLFRFELYKGDTLGFGTNNGWHTLERGCDN